MTKSKRKKPESSRKSKQTVEAVIKIGDFHAHRKVSQKFLKSEDYNSLKRKGVIINPDDDSDGDGIKNKQDCKPLNKKEQGLVHNIIAGTGTLAGYVGGEVVSGVKDIPLSATTQYAKTKDVEKTKTIQKRLDTEKEIQQLVKKQDKLSTQIILEKEETKRLKKIQKLKGV